MESRQLFFQRIAYRSTHEGFFTEEVAVASTRQRSQKEPRRPDGDQTARLRCKDQIRQLLLLARFLWRKAAIGSGSKLLLELVDAACGVHVFELPCVKGVTFIANVDLQLGADTSSRERVATTTANGGFLVIGVDAVFHRVLSVFLGVRKRVLALGTAPGNPEMYATGMLLFKGSLASPFPRHVCAHVNRPPPPSIPTPNFAASSGRRRSYRSPTD